MEVAMAAPDTEVEVASSSQMKLGGERNILYKGVETSPQHTRFKNLDRRSPKRTISASGGLGSLQGSIDGFQNGSLAGKLYTVTCISAHREKVLANVLNHTLCYYVKDPIEGFEGANPTINYVLRRTNPLIRYRTMCSKPPLGGSPAAAAPTPIRKEHRSYIDALQYK